MAKSAKIFYFCPKTKIYQYNSYVLHILALEQTLYLILFLLAKIQPVLPKNRSKQPGLSNCALKLSYLKITHMSYTIKQIETPIIFIYKVEKCETTPGHHYGQHQGTIRQHQGTIKQHQGTIKQHQGTETTPGHQVRQHQGIM